MIGLHHIISLFIYSLISFFNRKNNPHFHPSSYVGTLTSFLTSSSALELAFPSDAERCFFTPTTYHRCLKYLTKAGCSTISLSAPKPETYLGSAELISSHRQWVADVDPHSDDNDEKPPDFGQGKTKFP